MDNELLELVTGVGLFQDAEDEALRSWSHLASTTAEVLSTKTRFFLLSSMIGH